METGLYRAVDANVLYIGVLLIRCYLIAGRRHLYWNDCTGAGTLETSKLDGRGRRTLLRGVGCVLSLNIDMPLNCIYWVNMYGPGVGHCPLSNCTKVYSVSETM